MPRSASSGDVTIYLVAGDAGDGNEHDLRGLGTAAAGRAGTSRPAAA